MKTLLVVGLLVAQAGLSTLYPITIDCTDTKTPGTTLKVQLSPALNLAKLDYESAGQTMSMLIDRPYGIYSSTSVTIKSKVTGGYLERLSLEIAAQESIVMRVTDYAQFNLRLEQDEQGNFQAVQLNYRRGIDAFPDSQVEGLVTLHNMSCSVNGL